MIDTAGIIILNKNKHILVLKATGSKEHWTIPKGHIEKGESPIQAAIRETREEAGIDLDEKHLISLGSQAYNNKKKRIHVFLANMRDFEDVEPRLNWEHTAYKWVSSEEGEQLVHEAQKKFFLFLRELLSE